MSGCSAYCRKLLRKSSTMEMIIAGTLHRWRKVITFNNMLDVIDNNQVDQYFREFGEAQNCIQLVALTDALFAIYQ
jgi:hypothetical protein